MKKLISYLLILVMMLSLVPTFAYAAETVKEEKEPLKIEDWRYIFPYVIEVEIFNEFSYETFDESFDVDFFSGYVPEGMELDYVEFWDYDGSNATVRIDVPGNTIENAINLAMGLHKHPKVKSINFLYYDIPPKSNDEEKIPLEINENAEFDDEGIVVMIFNAFSYELFNVDFFAGYIPEGIEIKEISLVNSYHKKDDDFNAILYLQVDPTTSEKIIDFVKTVYNHPKVKIAELNYALIIDPIETGTDTKAESESETALDTVESAVGEDTGKVTEKAEETVFESESEAETEAVASVGKNNNKQTGDSLFIYVTLALLASSVASTVVILKKGKKKED